MFNWLLWLVSLACAIWVIYDVFAMQKKMQTVHKVLWTIAALLFSVITAIVYYLLVKRK